MARSTHSVTYALRAKSKPRLLDGDEDRIQRLVVGGRGEFQIQRPGVRVGAAQFAQRDRRKMRGDVIWGQRRLHPARHCQPSGWANMESVAVHLDGSLRNRSWIVAPSTAAIAIARRTFGSLSPRSMFTTV